MTAEETVAETVFEMVMRKMFGVYFIQIITLLTLILTVVSGYWKKVINWFTSLRKVKVGKVEWESGAATAERRNEKRRREDKNTAPCVTEKCAKYNGLQALIGGIDEKLGAIKNNIEDLYEITADHEEYLIKVSQGTLENHVFNEAMAPFRRLKSFRRLLALGKNGRVKEKGLKLILKNKETWKDVNDTPLDTEVTDPEYYAKVMNEIETRIFDGSV